MYFDVPKAKASHGSKLLDQFIRYMTYLNKYFKLNMVIILFRFEIKTKSYLSLPCVGVVYENKGMIRFFPYLFYFDNYYIII